MSCIIKHCQKSYFSVRIRLIYSCHDGSTPWYSYHTNASAKLAQMYVSSELNYILWEITDKTSMINFHFCPKGMPKPVVFCLCSCGHFQFGNVISVHKQFVACFFLRLWWLPSYEELMVMNCYLHKTSKLVHNLTAIIQSTQNTCEDRVTICHARRYPHGQNWQKPETCWVKVCSKKSCLKESINFGVLHCLR